MFVFDYVQIHICTVQKCFYSVVIVDALCLCFFPQSFAVDEPHWYPLTSSKTCVLLGNPLYPSLLLLLWSSHISPQHGSEYLDQAFLHFFEQFRMVYVGDVMQKTSGVSLV